MQAVIVRPPLVYGPGVRANFLRLLRLVHQGWPLPFGAVRNARSLASVWNLCDFLLLLLTHPKAPGRTWMICDGEDLSTPELIRRLGHAMERPVRLPSRACGAPAIMCGTSRAPRRACATVRFLAGRHLTEPRGTRVVTAGQRG
jgi:nucleoside-diphosphate-sugar epimerase